MPLIVRPHENAPPVVRLDPVNEAEGTKLTVHKSSQILAIVSQLPKPPANGIALPDNAATDLRDFLPTKFSV